jgi:hypothetical protein
VAVAGPPLPDSVCESLVSDALADTLSPDRGALRLVVPAAPDSLTEGVRAVVEWAWAQQPEPHVTAIYDGHIPFSEVERVFLENGADEVRQVPDVAAGVVKELVAAAPDSALLVVLHEAEPDALTMAILGGCFDAEIPVFDVSHGAIPLCRNDVWGWEPSPEEKEEDVVDAPAGDVAPLAEEPAVEEAPEPKMAVASIPVDPPTEHEVLRALRAQFVRIEKTAAEAINSIDDTMAGKVRPRPARDYPILISTDGGVTKRPRGRGKAPKGSIEYNGKTGEVLRVH